MYKLEIEVNFLPKPANQLLRRHWSLLTKEKNKCHNAVLIAIGPNKPDKPLQKAELHLTRCSSSMPDYDGLVSSFKYIIDGLVKAGVIVDDKPAIIGYPTYEWEKANRGQGTVRVRIKEITDDSQAQEKSRVS